MKGVVCMKKYVLILIAILWMGLIFSFSSKDINASLKQSDIFVKKIENNQLLAKASAEKIPTSLLVRKTAHFSIYFVLALILAPLIKRNNNDLKGSLITVFVVFLYACSDEFHQIFVKGRGSHFTDVLIDSFGGAIGVFLSMKINELLKGNQKKMKFYREFG